MHVKRLWALFFALVPILGVATFVWAPYSNHWMPHDISEHGHQIDHLWMFILILTGVVFILTEVTLAWFMWRYERTSRQESTVAYTHGSHNLEIIWTTVPAATLLFIALYQMNAWAEVKIDQPNIPPTVRVTARQFEWRLQYPGADGQLGTSDDIYHVNDLHLPLDEKILLELESADVLHDFFVPSLRVKQDAVPGSRINMWFMAKETGQYDLVCAELCGWGHYKMKGRITIEPREAYEAWLAETYQKQIATE